MLLTLGIAFHNVRPTFEQALKSVFAQTFQDWELLLVDDGSDDGSLDIALAVDDPRVRVISDGRNRGLVYRINQIAAEARGRYMARVDGDDIMHPERLARQVDYMESHPQTDCVFSPAYIIDGRGRLIGARGTAPLNPRPEVVLRRGLAIHPTALGHTQWFRDFPYDPRFERAEDLELWCRTCRTSRFARLEEPLYYYRESWRPPWEYLHAYLATERSHRLIIRLYGPAAVGSMRAAAMMLESYAKCGLYCALTVLAMQDGAIRRRTPRLGSAQRDEALRGLELVAGTQTPGLSRAVRVLANDQR